MAFYRALAFALATCVVAEDPKCQADEHVLLQGVMRKVVKTDVERMTEEFEDEGGSRVAADQLAPPPIDGFAPGVRGWCRTANGEAEDGVSVPPQHVYDCAAQCRASPTCQAFEFSGPRRGRQFPRACKLYNSPMPGPVGEIESDADGYAQCYNTAVMFFNNAVGAGNMIGFFEEDDDVTGAGGYFLRRVDCASRVIRAHVQGGSCGDAIVQFRINDAVAEYFRSGVQGRRSRNAWQPLSDVTVVSGEVPHPPREFYIGSTSRGIRGWLLVENHRERNFGGRSNVFAGSYKYSNWDGCNSNPLEGGETVTLQCV